MAKPNIAATVEGCRYKLEGVRGGLLMMQSDIDSPGGSVRGDMAAQFVEILMGAVEQVQGQLCDLQDELEGRGDE